MPSDKDREEARRREAMDFVRKIFRTFTGELQAHPVDVTLERDACISAEALREAAERFRSGCCPLPELEKTRPRYKAPATCSECAMRFGDGYCTEVSVILSANPSTDEGGARECVWTEDADGLWKTSCGRSWTFIEGGPKDNRVNYCHGCGNPVRIAGEEE